MAGSIRQEQQQPVIFLPEVDPSKAQIAVTVRANLVTPVKLAQLTPYSTTFRQWSAVGFEGTRLDEPAASSGSAKLGDEYIFAEWQGGPTFCIFYFVRKRTAEEKAVAWRSYPDVEPSVYWPPVLQGFGAENFLAYDANGDSYVADVNWDFDIRDAYDGPCEVLVEEFVSHEPFTIPVPSILRPNGDSFYYGVGSVTLPRCLRPTLTFTYSTGTNSSKYPYQVFSKTMPGTYYIDWPALLVISDQQVQTNNVWVRRKKTAKSPSIF